MPRTAFACSYHEPTRTLVLSGDVDESGAEQLRWQLALLAGDRTRRPLVMDLSSVQSLPSVAVGVIAAARAAMRSRFDRLELVAAPGSVACAVLPRSGMTVHECASPNGKPPVTLRQPA